MTHDFLLMLICLFLSLARRLMRTKWKVDKNTCEPNVIRLLPWNERYEPNNWIQMQRKRDARRRLKQLSDFYWTIQNWVTHKWKHLYNFVKHWPNDLGMKWSIPKNKFKWKHDEQQHQPHHINILTIRILNVLIPTKIHTHTHVMNECMDQNKKKVIQ